LPEPDSDANLDAHRTVASFRGLVPDRFCFS